MMAGSISMRSLAVWAFLAFGSNVVSAASCNADNCLRALFPTQSPAVYSSDAAFCATFTATVHTQTTGFPSKASAACGTAPARYSSACSCKPKLASTLTSTTTSTSSTSRTSTTSTSTSTTSTSSTSTSTTSTSSTSTTTGPTCLPTHPVNDAVSNGGFECGLPPWIPEDIPGTSHAITSPGDASNFAYEFDQVGPVAPSAFTTPAAVSQVLATVAGIPYTLRFRTYFDKCTGSEGFVGVKINGQPIYTVDACDNAVGVFADNTVQFTAVGADNLRFEFIIGETPAVVKIDNVSAVPLH